MLRLVLRASLCAALLVSSLVPLSARAAEAPTDPSKATVLGKYLTAAEAYAMIQAAPGKVALIDVRTPEEYDFLGHPAMAENIPLALWTGKFDAASKSFPLAPNQGFVEAVAKRHQKGDTLLVMCRSGQRSAPAVNKLAQAGFTEAYSVIDGFEGDKVTDKNSPDFGKRKLNGWLNSKLPWTYSLDEKLVYQPGQ